MNKKIISHVIVSSMLLLSIAGCQFPEWGSKKNKGTEEKTGIIISLIGAPLSGKGTLADRACKELEFKSLSTGNLLRACVASGTEKAKAIESSMKAGELVSDKTVNELVEEWLTENTKTTPRILLDGYPRSQQQAEMLISLLKEKFPQYQLTIVTLTIPEGTLIARAADRLFCPQCQTTFNRKKMNLNRTTCPDCHINLIRRKDDTEEVVHNRLKLYAEKSREIIAYYQSQCEIALKDLLLDGKTSQEEDFENFKKLINLTTQDEKPATKQALAPAAA